MTVQLQRLWEIEEGPKTKHPTASDKYCKDLFRHTTRRDLDGRFVVSLPFKRDVPSESPLGASRPIALRQFLRNEANFLKKNQEFKSSYDSFLQEFIALEHMKGFPPSSKDDQNLYYSPHHPVFEPESTTPSSRVVFNASSGTSNDRNLHEVLHSGPVLQTIQLEHTNIPSLSRMGSPVSDRASSPALSLEALFEVVNPAMVEDADVNRDTGATEQATTFRCRVCEKKHPLRFCRRFKRLTIVKRLRMVVQYRYCARCLAQSHRTARCPSTATCSVCGSDHNTLLHFSNGNNRPKQRQPQTGETVARRLISRTARTARQPFPTASAYCASVLLPTCVVGVIAGARRIAARALLDPCSAMSRVHASLTSQAKIPVTRIGGENFCELSLVAMHDHAIRLSLRAKVVRDKPVITPSRDLPENLKDGLPNLILADPQFFRQSPVRLVLGANIYGDIIQPEQMRFRGLPLAQSTLFGWVLSGPCVS